MSREADASAIGRRAMVLAAGLGLRMRPLTESCPKPLIKVAGKTLIDHALDRLDAAGVDQVVVNVHHLADQLERWADQRSRPRIVLADERQRLLDTGGGVVNALPLLGRAPFFVLNSDSLWLEGTTPALERLRQAWSDDIDGLLLVVPTAQAVGYAGSGDFHLDAEGRLTRRRASEVAPFVFAGCYVAAPRLFDAAPQGPFSTNLVWDRALAHDRLRGLCHDGLWLHVGTPEAIDLAEGAIEDNR